MTPNLLDELEKIVALSEKATQGSWSQDTGGDVTRDDGETLFVREIPDGDDDISFANTDLVEAAVNFLRTHAPTLADMAKRMEAAERDAGGEREESWEVWQDDMCVASSDSLADAQHYMLMYGQDGQVKMVHVVTFRSDVIETVPADQFAIDATQEGAG